MLGIKSRIAKYLEIYVSRKSVVNEGFIQKLMCHFNADEQAHQANISKSDLGFGWFHYSMVRMKKPHNVLCIGSRHGYIPAILAQACRDNGFGNVYFVDAGFGEDDKDHWTGDGYWRTEKGLKTFQTFNTTGKLYNFISLYVMTTEVFAKTYPELVFDYVYIDGNHSYEGVRFDFETFFPRLRETGLVSFHDINVKQRMPEGLYGVHKLWPELKGKYRHTLEFSFGGSGLGILQKI